MKKTAEGVLVFLLCIVNDAFVVFKFRAIIASASFGFMVASVASLFVLFPAGLYLFSESFQEKVDGIYKKLVKHRRLYWSITFFAWMIYTSYAVNIAAVLQGWTLLPLNIILDLFLVGARNKPPVE